MLRSLFGRPTARCLTRVVRKSSETNIQALAVGPRFFTQVSPPVRVDQPKIARPPRLVQARNYGVGDRYTDLSHEEFVSLLESGDIQLFDVREPEEVKSTGMIPGAVNIPLGEVKAAFKLSEEKFLETYRINKPHNIDRNIVFYGLGPIKSTAALELVQKVGFNKARHYVGGWEEWSMRQKGKK